VLLCQHIAKDDQSELLAACHLDTAIQTGGIIQRLRLEQKDVGLGVVGSVIQMSQKWRRNAMRAIGRPSARDEVFFEIDDSGALGTVSMPTTSNTHAGTVPVRSASS
jgi:hypothetical protein